MEYKNFVLRLGLINSFIAFVGYSIDADPNISALNLCVGILCILIGACK